ncbi:trafficking protein particle complex subunit 8 [Dendrobium catenatum]|uniref:N-acetyltransferase n=1 Tax=Dendrobium catenatum TaxID=906689 RepID=A0A2I0WC84_9ASPA|nr:trafficking protein particle complex subunit 8 [Dendrobium catenatum]PKU73262.1 N-acetyltransferase [Dendrobium catenatum]
MMDPMRSLLGRVLLEEITPVVMVLSTPLAEEACRKNGLNFVEMLLPFSVFNKIDVPVRTASDQPYRLQMFKLRLVYASDIRQQDYKVAENHLKQLVSDAANAALSDLQSELPQLETILSETELNFCPSWIQTFNKELRKSVSFSEHEAFDHPVACLFVVSSNDAQPINRFVDLFNTDQLPSLLNDGVMDPKILKQYLLLHENHDGTMDRATGILAEMKSTFGSIDCRLLCINSSDGGDGELKDNPWLNVKAHLSASHEIGSFLNIDDLIEIKEFMQELSSKHIIPYMEQKIRFLNQQVSATRKGFRNQIKNLWWRKGKEDAPETTSGQMYTFSSMESQIRVLGDYAFILRDYELALSNYRLLSTDYKLDKAWKRYAGVQEMMGLAYFMLDQSRKDSETCMETAFNTYLKLVPSAQRNATRCGLWWAEILKARGQYKEAAGIYFRISSEEPPLHAAVMLEQASYSYLFSRPPMLRKYGFHLILAGNRYYVSDQRPHALRTYRNALLVYGGIPWNFILDHVHYNIGRWYAFVGVFDVSVKHMLEILACSHQSATTQHLFLGNFFETVENMGKIFEVNKLQLPVVNMSSIQVIFEDHRTYASFADLNVNENLWKSLEEEMVPLASTIKSNWLESQSKLSLKKYDDSHVCVVGEAIKLDIEFRNPLQIPISVSSLSLICDICEKSKEAKIDGGTSSFGFNDIEELKEAPSCRSRIGDVSNLVLSEFDLVLGGGEAKRIQLDATPKIEGVLKVLGVRWKLSELVVGYHYFEPNMKMKHKKGKRVARNSSGGILNFIVIKGLPKLEGCIHNLPGTTFAGDFRLLRMELRNQSEYSVKNMRMAISHPRFLSPGNLEDFNMDFPCYLEKQKFSKSMEAPANAQKFKNLLFYFPNDVTIEGGAAFYWPLWFHASFSGKISLYLSVYYEIESCSSDMIYRTLRMHYDLEVLPSLDLSIHIAPCPSKLQEFLMRMDIMNRTSTESFSMQQLSCVGDELGISRLPANETISPLKVLHAGQALSCFFKLKDCSKSFEYETGLAFHGKDEKLDAQGNGKVLIDVSRSPFLEFHQQERYHQGKTAEGGISNIDFILISELHDSSSTGLHPSILSFHACHCSITNEIPLWWLMEGPRVMSHDFSVSFCEIDLELTICNCLNAEVSIRIITHDFMPETKLSDYLISDSNTNQGGWHNVSLANDIKEISNVQSEKLSSSSSQSISPFIWCAASSTSVKMQPLSTANVPLRICIFSPGTFDLSSYELHWNVQSSSRSDKGRPGDDATRSSSGMSRGHPFYLTVMQSH